MKNIFIFSTLFLFFNIANAQVQIGADIDGETQDDYSGSSVSVSSDGQFLAIGAPQNDGNGNDSGHVRVFQKVGSSWVQQGADIDGPSPGDWAGTVAISDDGTRVVIGAKYINANGGASGHARIYSYDGTVWTQLGSDINGEAAFDYAGHAVSMSADGNTIAIGATHNDGNGVTDGGHTRVYSFTGGNWVQKGGDIDGESTQDNSGWSVSLTADGNTVAIGAYKNNANGTDAGHVRIFEFVGGSWVQKGADIDGGAGDRFGWDVAISADGNTIVAGGTHNTNAVGYQAGVTRVYRYVGSTWTQLGQDLFGESLVDWFGYSVAISDDGNTIASSATQNDGTGPSAGNVKVFQLSNSSWVQVGSDIDGENSGDWSGYEIDMSCDGSTVVVGALNNNPSGSAPYTGHVRAFDMSSVLPVELGYFHAHLTSTKEVLLEWLTYSEINNDYFEILKSTDGIDFVSLGKVSGAGNSTTTEQYEFLDKEPKRGINYYQLRQVDKDGSQTYSEIQVVEFDFKRMKIYPNPVVEELVLNNFEGGIVRIVNFEGKVVYENSLDASAALIIPVYNLVPGMYFLQGDWGMMPFVK